MSEPTRSQLLEYRLSQRDVTAEEFQEYCTLRSKGSAEDGMVLPDPAWFAPPEAIAAFWQAVDWWPKDLPMHPVPRLVELALLYPQMPGRDPLTLEQTLWLSANRVVPVLNELKRSVVNPNETYEERHKRLNRERVKKWRDARKEGSDAQPTSEEEAYIADLEQQLAQELRDRPAQLETLRAQREEMKALYYDACAKVKKAEEDSKTLTASLRSQIKTMRSTP